MSFHHSQAGFSLVSTLVAVAIAGILMVALATTFKNSFQASRGVAQSTSVEMLRQQVMTLLANPNVCYSSLKNVTLGRKNTINIEDTVTGPVVFLRQGQKVDSVTLTKLEADVGRPGPANAVIATITAEISKNPDSDGPALGKLTHTATVYVNLLTDGTKVLKCYATEDPRFMHQLDDQVLTISPPGSWNGFNLNNLGSATYKAQGNLLKLSFPNVMQGWQAVGVYAELRAAVKDLTTGTLITTADSTGRIGWIVGGVAVDPSDTIYSGTWANPGANIRVTPDHVYQFTYRLYIGHPSDTGLPFTTPITNTTFRVSTPGPLQVKIEDWLKPQ